MINQALEKTQFSCLTKERHDAEDWIGRIKHIENELVKMTDRTEEEILSLSASFTDFHSRAKTISRWSSTVAAEMTGAEIVMAVDGLNGLLEKTETYMNRSETAMRMRREKMSEIRNMIHNIHDPLECFQPITKTLRYLGVTARLQSAPLLEKNTELKVLLDEVTKLSGIVSARTDSIQKGLISQMSLFEQTLSEIFHFEEKQQSKAKLVVEKTISILLSLTEQYGLSTVAARNISARSSEISRSTDEIVIAVQFQDITNQQFGGVKKALAYAHKNCRPLFDGRVSIPDDNNMVEMAVTKLRAFFRHQAVQLDHARKTFVTAVEGIADNLRRIGVNMADMSSDIQKITGNAGMNRKTFISEMEGMLHSVKAALTVITEDAETRRKLLDTMLFLSGNVKDEMTQFIRGIEEIADDIELVAFNTEIKSSQIGKEGAALDVVASRVKHLSYETSAQAEMVSEILRIINASADELSSGITADVEGSSEEAAIISVELERLELTFSGLNENIVPLFVEIDKNTRDLSGDIEGLTKRINVHKIVDEGVKKSVSELNSLLSSVSSILPGGVKPSGVQFGHARQLPYQVPIENAEVELLAWMNEMTECSLTADYDLQERSFNDKNNSVDFF